MRWFWIDRFIEFERCRRAVAVKNVSLVEEQMDGYLPGMAYMPPSLIIEGLAQAGGLLVGDCGQFREKIVLAKVARAEFHFLVSAGETLHYTVEIDDIRPDGAICQGTSHLQNRLQARMELVFAILDDRFSDDFFAPDYLIRWLRLLRLYEVGRDEDGNPLAIPPHLLEAECQVAGSNNSTGRG